MAGRRVETAAGEEDADSVAPTQGYRSEQGGGRGTHVMAW